MITDNRLLSFCNAQNFTIYLRPVTINQSIKSQTAFRSFQCVRTSYYCLMSRYASATIHPLPPVLHSKQVRQWYHAGIRLLLTMMSTSVFVRSGQFRSRPVRLMIGWRTVPLIHRKLHPFCMCVVNRLSSKLRSLTFTWGSLKVECRVSSLKRRVWKKKTESAIFLVCVCVLPLALIALHILLTQALALRAFLALRWKHLALRTLLCVCWEGNQASPYPTLSPLCPAPRI